MFRNLSLLFLVLEDVPSGEEPVAESPEARSP